VEAKRFGSELKREVVSKESPWGVTESVGRRAADESRRCLLGPVGEQVRSTVRWNISGGRWHGGVEDGRLG